MPNTFPFNIKIPEINVNKTENLIINPAFDKNVLRRETLFKKKTNDDKTIENPK